MWRIGILGIASKSNSLHPLIMQRPGYPQQWEGQRPVGYLRLLPWFYYSPSMYVRTLFEGSIDTIAKAIKLHSNVASSSSSWSTNHQCSILFKSENKAAHQILPSYCPTISLNFGVRWKWLITMTSPGCNCDTLSSSLKVLAGKRTFHIIAQELSAERRNRTTHHMSWRCTKALTPLQ